MQHIDTEPNASQWLLVLVTVRFGGSGHPTMICTPGNTPSGVRPTSKNDDVAGAVIFDGATPLAGAAAPGNCLIGQLLEPSLCVCDVMCLT